MESSNKKMHSELAVSPAIRNSKVASLYITAFMVGERIWVGKVSFIEVVTRPVTFIEVALSHDCISAGKGRFDFRGMQMFCCF